MTKPTLVLDAHWRGVTELFCPADFAALHDLCEVVWGRDEPIPEALLGEALPQAEFYVAARPALDEARLARTLRLRAVVEVSGAFPDSIDYGACFARGIEVLCCAPGFRASVGEMALAMALGGARGLVAEHERFRRGEERWLADNEATDFSLIGQSVGFVGLGSIGREVVRLLQPFGCDLAAYDPWLDPEVARALGVRLGALDEIMDRSRCLFVAAAPTHENRGLIGRDLLERLPPGALVVLVSRSHLVDFEVLLDLAGAGRLRAAIDVFPEEPLPRDHRARGIPGVILSPHRAAAVPGGRQLIGEMIVDDVRAMLAGGLPQRLQRARPELIDSLAGVQGGKTVAAMASRR